MPGGLKNHLVENGTICICDILKFCDKFLLVVSHNTRKIKRMFSRVCSNTVLSRGMKNKMAFTLRLKTIRKRTVGNTAARETTMPVVQNRKTTTIRKRKHAPLANNHVEISACSYPLSRRTSISNSRYPMVTRWSTQASRNRLLLLYRFRNYNL